MLFERLALEDPYEGAFRPTAWELMVPSWLCDPQLAKEATCPKISALIKASITSYLSGGLSAKMQARNLMSGIRVQRSWLRE